MERSNREERPVLLVTGGSRGIGAAAARLGAQRGYAVAVNYLSSPEQAAALVQEIIAAGGRAEAFRADVGDAAQAAALFQQVEKVLGPPNALVNNAGISGGFHDIDTIDAPLLEQVFATNLFGAFHCIREAAARMRRDGKGGAVVNVSSQAARFGGNRLAHYAASKAGLEIATVALARELAPQGIRINAVSPGLIDTEQHRDMDPQRHRTLMASLPMGRMGRPMEAAEAILWLLSDQASYITGTILPVAGGR